MAQYKVPQDVEADDKLIGPFSFRQFVYLLIAGALIALAVAFFQIFPLLALVPVPFVLFFGALALPLKKDQPMETYLAAIISYYIKPRQRLWTPGQRESTIQITAPKIVEDERARDITGEEATHRLSFLADIVDTEGYAIKGGGINQISEDLIAEANTMNDIFESNHFDSLENTIARDENERHAEVIKEMKETIAKTENLSSEAMEHATIEKRFEEGKEEEKKPDFNASVVVKPEVEKKSEDKPEEKPVEEPTEEKESEMAKIVEKSAEDETEQEQKVEEISAKPSIIELANNEDYSVATIAKEANRLKERDEGEVFISLR